MERNMLELVSILYDCCENIAAVVSIRESWLEETYISGALK